MHEPERPARTPTAIGFSPASISEVIRRRPIMLRRHEFFGEPSWISRDMDMSHETPFACRPRSGVICVRFSSRRGPMPEYP